MKKRIRTAVICICMLASTSAFSQQKDPSQPAWVSLHGYWVIESNTYQPGWHMVRFYDNSHTLIGEQQITNAKLNIKKKKVKMRLKFMLEAQLELWAKQHPVNDNTPIAKVK